jgi:hypothetical protein
MSEYSQQSLLSLLPLSEKDLDEIVPVPAPVKGEVVVG